MRVPDPTSTMSIREVPTILPEGPTMLSEVPAMLSELEGLTIFTI